jgi:hypothetical protein
LPLWKKKQSRFPLPDKGDGAEPEKKGQEFNMRVAISTDRGYVSAHLGRCPAYAIVDIEEKKVLAREEIPNPGHEPGFLLQYAQRVLESADVRVISAEKCSVREDLSWLQRR